MLRDPPTFIRILYELYNIQVHQLLTDLSTCQHSPLTTIGTKIKVHTSASANSDLLTDLPKGDEFMYSPMHNVVVQELCLPPLRTKPALRMILLFHGTTT